jgi:hypothetical protein
MNGELSKLNVYYGWSVVNKIRIKPAISIIFENTSGESERNQNSIKRLQKTCYVRRQTVEEAEDGKKQNRSLTEYSLFLMQKPFYGDVDMLLETNYQADINNVPEPVLNEIRKALKEGFKMSDYQGPIKR